MLGRLHCATLKSGIISLDNNGGFPSARGHFDPEIERRATGATSLRVRALGDGKTYLLKVETGRPWSYVQRFATDAGISTVSFVTWRAILGAFLFRKDDVHKKVAVLSGGEKSRLALVKLLVNPPNFLLMDEPTTHLDISSIDALISALQGYEGTLLFVSHDVHFIRQVAKTVLHVHSGRLTPYAGDYGYYLEKSKAGNERAALTAGFTDGRPKQAETVKPEKSKATAKPSASDLRKLKSEVAKLEQQIAELEAKQAALTAELADPATYAQGAKVQQLNADLKGTGEALQAATTAWEQAAQKLSEAEGA